MKASLIGIGAMGKNHYRALKNNDDIKEICIVDNCKNNLFKEKWYVSVDDMLRSEDPDIAIVATPTFTHKEITIKLLKNNVNVLVEKPVAKSTNECEELFDIARETGCKLAVGHIERFNPAIQSLIDDLSTTKQNVVNCCIRRISPYPSRIKDIGVSLDLSIHDVDLARFITKKEIQKCSFNKMSLMGEREDLVSFYLSLENNTSVSIVNSWTSPIRERSIDVLTDKYYYKLDLLRQTAERYTHYKNLESIKKDLFVQRKDALQEQLKDFIRYVNVGKIGSLASLQDASIALSYVEEKEV
jgi:UDP-N-acetylglucosamine 3-dehydrogenase